MVDAEIVAGDEAKLLAEPELDLKPAEKALEPETADTAGMVPDLVIAPMDIEPVAVNDAKQEGDGVSSAL